MRRGNVIEFDEAVGLGAITGHDGVTYRFHLIEIDDGTRTIEVGQPVGFEPLRRFGEVQAGSVQKL